MTFWVSNMVISLHSDKSYLNAPQAQSRAGGHFSMSENNSLLCNNGAILTIVQIIKRVMTSVVEAELDVLFLNTGKTI